MILLSTASIQFRRCQSFGMLAIVCAIAACRSDNTGPVSANPNQIYWALQLNHHAVNIDTSPPHNTIQLTAIPVAAVGTPLEKAYTVSYSAKDSNVTVSPTGLVTAHFATLGQAVPVTASLTIKGVTFVDTALVQVTDTTARYPLTTFSLQPAPGDSAKLSVYNLGVFPEYNPLPIYAVDAMGDTLRSKTMNHIAVYFTSSDPAVAIIDRTTGTISPQHVGQVTFSATSWVYGVEKTDSLHFTIGRPVLAGVNLAVARTQTPVGHVTSVLMFTPKTIVVAMGGIVLFQTPTTNAQTDSVDIVFDDSTVVQGAFGGPGGNIPPIIGPDRLVPRTFPIAGTYSFHSRLFSGTSGTIIVKD